MAFDYINEAFKKLDILDEAMFDTSSEGINNLMSYIEDEDTSVRVIDADASSDEDLKDSYVGKIIVNCNVCHSHIFENKEDIEIDDEGVVNGEVSCPYCGEKEGFVIVGEIAPYQSKASEAEEPSVEIVPSEETSEESEAEEIIVTQESMSRATARVISEDFKEVCITTEDQHMEMTSDENGKVTVTTEPIKEDVVEEEETIQPVSDETVDELISDDEDNAPEVLDSVEAEEDTATDDTAEETTPSETLEETSDEYDVDFEDVDEEGMDELGESYFCTVYDNVESFKTTDVSATSTSLIVEGVIKFASGVEKKTGFVFEAQDVNSRGQVRFSGSNKHLSESADAFSLVGRVDNKKLFVESLKYNYSVDGAPIRGRVTRK